MWVKVKSWKRASAWVNSANVASLQNTHDEGEEYIMTIGLVGKEAITVFGSYSDLEAMANEIMAPLLTSEVHP